MRFVVVVVTLLIVLLGSSEAFQSTSFSARSSSPFSTALFGKRRQSKRNREVERSRPKSFYDKIEDATSNSKEANNNNTEEGGPPVATKEKTKAEGGPPKSEIDYEREERAREARERMEQRPMVSTMIVDDESGAEMVAQGKNVMDVVTRKAVQLSPLGPQFRLAQMFPGVPPDVSDKYRFDWKTIEVPEMVESLREACSVRGEIPPHPSVANKAIDFAVANRDRMGPRMKQVLGRLTMREASLGNKEQALANQKLWKNFLTLENHISAPFRQMMMDAEGRVGPNFGNLDLMAFANGEIYERTANYLVLKGMVAHWEKKIVDADANEKTMQTPENYMRSISRGDPRRYLPDPPILFTLKECTQVCYMAQQMTETFVNSTELFSDLPPEVRFIEPALTIKGGTALRKYIIEDFCPQEGIEPDRLREGVRRLYTQMENMQIDPYGDLTNILQKLILAMSVGTEDERDPYTPYFTDPNGPGSFQTYTFNHDKLSLVRFLDGQYTRSDSKGDTSSKPSGGGGLGGFFKNFASPAPAPAPTTQSSSSEETYKVPAARAIGRPHELGWLDILNDQPKDENMRLGRVPAGRIIPDDVE